MGGKRRVPVPQYEGKGFFSSAKKKKSGMF